MDRGFGRCLVAKKFASSLRRYSNGAVDRSVGPSDASEFPAGKEDQRFKKQVRVEKIVKIYEFLCRSVVSFVCSYTI